MIEPSLGGTNWKKQLLCVPCDHAAMQCMLFLFVCPTQHADCVCVWNDLSNRLRTLYADMPQPHPIRSAVCLWKLYLFNSSYMLIRSCIQWHDSVVFALNLTLRKPLYHFECKPELSPDGFLLILRKDKVRWAMGYVHIMCCYGL